VVHFFHDVVGEPVIDKAVLSRRTSEYQGWVEAYARNQGIPIEWAEPNEFDHLNWPILIV
jgi:hypothetical protein